MHEVNGGVGAAIVTGYERCRDEGIDVTCVMAADNQMDPAELIGLVDAGRAGRDRLREGEPARHGRGVDADPARALPRQRGALAADEDRLGLLARRRLAGRLHGALARRAAPARPRPRLPPLRVPERHARAPERRQRTRARRSLAADLRRRRESGIKVSRVAPRIAWLLFKGFWWRMKEKYVIRDFHPLVFFYVLGALMTVLGLVLGSWWRSRGFLRQRDHDADDRPRRPAAHLGDAVHPVRDVVRPGGEQGPALSSVLEPF